MHEFNEGLWHGWLIACLYSGPGIHFFCRVNHDHELINCTVILRGWGGAVRTTDHCSSIIFSASHPIMGVTLFICSREAVSAYVAGLLLSNAISHSLATSAASEPVER